MDDRQDEQGKLISMPDDILGLYLKSTDLRTDTSRKPIPEVSASSSSAWNPLLNATMENMIKPDVERWRGTLDTLLIFVSLSLPLSWTRSYSRPS